MTKIHDANDLFDERFNKNLKKKENIYLIRFPKVWRVLLKGVIIHDGRYVTSEIEEGGEIIVVAIGQCIIFIGRVVKELVIQRFRFTAIGHKRTRKVTFEVVQRHFTSKCEFHFRCIGIHDSEF